MSQIDTHRAAYNKPNGNIRCGKQQPTLPTVTKQVEIFYTVDANGKRMHCNSVSQVNAKLLLYPNAKVVRSERTTVITTTHKRVK